MPLTARCRGLAPAFIALLLAGGDRLTAQEPQSAPQEPAAPIDTTQVAERASIPFGEIPARVEQDAVRIRDVERRAAEPAPIVVEVERELPIESESIATRLRSLERENLTLLSLRALQDRQLRWLRTRSRLSGWQSALETRWQLLQADDDVLESLAAAWEATEEALEEATTAPEGLATLVSTSLDEIARVNDEVRARRDVVLDLQTRIATRQDDVTRALELLTASRSRARRALFRQGSRPVWALGRLDMAERGVEVSQSWDRTRLSVRYYVEQERGRLYLHLFLFALLLALTLSAARKHHPWLGDDPADRATAHVLSRPISSALLVALVLSLLVHPLAPNAWGDLLILASIPVVARLIPPDWTVTRRTSEYAFLAILALDSISHLLTEGSVIARLSHFTINLAALGWVAWVLRAETGRLRSTGGPWSGRALFVLRSAAALLLVAVLSNLFGYRRLSEYLTDGTLMTLYVVLVVLVGALVLTSLVHFLPQSRLTTLLPSLRRHSGSFTRRGTAFVRLGCLVLGVWLAFRQFDLDTQVVEAVGAVLRESIDIGSLHLSLGGLLAFGFVLWLAFALSRTVRFLLREEVLPRLDLERGSADAIATFSGWFIIALGIVGAASAAGLQGGQLAVLAGALGVGIGFGLQNVVNNFVSGLILIFERPIKVGDKVEVGTLLGEVRRIGIRASVVRTLDGAEVVVPNGNLVSEQVVNWTLSDQRRRVQLPVGVAYGTDPEVVLRLLEGVAVAHTDVLEYPAPDALFFGFGDSSLDFSLRFWTGDFDDFIRVKSEMAVAVNRELASAGIEIPFPQRDLHLKTVAPEAGGRLSGEPAGSGDGSRGAGSAGSEESRSGGRRPS